VNGEKLADRFDPFGGGAEQAVDLQPVAGAENRGLQDLIVGPKALEGTRQRMFRDAQPFPDLHGSRSMAEPDDG
jgi:hypothetical protein